MTRTPMKPVSLLFVAMLALSVALVGTATVGNAATAITKAQVKKIAKRVATKVVKKAAPTLSVANATNATNATNLNGLPASAYQTPVYTFALPVSAVDDNVRVYNLPGVPAGNYLATYSVLAQAGAAIAMDCYIRTSPAAPTREAWSYNAPFSVFNTLNASAPVTITAATANLQCEGSGNWGITEGGLGVVSRVTLVRVDSGTSLTTTVTRPAAKPGGGSASVR